MTAALLDTVEEYLHRNESALRKLLDGSRSYVQILKDAPSPVLVGSLPEGEDVNALVAAWAADNELAIQKSLEAQRRFIAESIARAAICGSILQITYMAIQLYSTNRAVPLKYQGVGPKNVGKFCIGREIRDIPVGLIVYAGRNQYNHMDESRLSKLNEMIFKELATNYIDGVSDPAFDLKKRALLVYSANIVSLLEWNTYEVIRDELISIIK